MLRSDAVQVEPLNRENAPDAAALIRRVFTVEFPALVSECADTVDLDDLIAADGDLLDAIVADDRLATVGEVWRCALIGVLRRPDGDDKLIVVPEDRSQTSDLSGVIDGFSERLTSWWDQNERSVGCQGVDAAAQLLLDCMQVGSLFEETERG